MASLCPVLDKHSTSGMEKIAASSLLRHGFQMVTFLPVDLVDEVSLLLVPGIDGRHEIPAVFDGVNSASSAAVPFKLKSVERRRKDMLWLRYEVVRS